jgi:hypothetical protein
MSVRANLSPLDAGRGLNASTYGRAGDGIKFETA